MEKKTRGWINIIGSLVAGYFVYAGKTEVSLYLLALLFLISGLHHVFDKQRK
jgi:hypothetical protein